MTEPARGATTLTRRALTRTAAACALASSSFAAVSGVNAPRAYPARRHARTLDCVVDLGRDLGAVDRRIFGTNLEWFNDAGGLNSPDPELREALVELAREQKIRVARFPGGTLADYYDWRDGTGRAAERPVRQHPTDSGRSSNGFGSPEFFRFLQQTGAEGLITLNAGTGTAREAAEWVAYANRPDHAGRAADGHTAPAQIRLWEVGNELYLPGNPGERKITQTPEAYATHFLAFADAIRAIDPAAIVIAIGTARAHRGPDTPYPRWTETVLAAAAPKIDMIAVHNAYFPILYTERQPPVEQVYKALWAAPEAVARSLAELAALIDRHERGRPIGIAVTEWGALFSVPSVDPFWANHVKTLGSAVYVARLLQVFIGSRRMQLSNYFKFADRSFMGWAGFDARPKVPAWVFRLYAETTGDRRVAAAVDSPTYDAQAIGIVQAEANVPEVTAVATRSAAAGQVFVNLVNRSMTSLHTIRMVFKPEAPAGPGEIRSVSGPEPTAHNGPDGPPELPTHPEHEPYSSVPPGSFTIETRPWSPGDVVELPPFSVATLVLPASSNR